MGNLKKSRSWKQVANNKIAERHHRRQDANEVSAMKLQTMEWGRTTQYERSHQQLIEKGAGLCPEASDDGVGAHHSIRAQPSTTYRKRRSSLPHPLLRLAMKNSKKTTKLQIRFLFYRSRCQQ